MPAPPVKEPPVDVQPDVQPIQTPPEPRIIPRPQKAQPSKPQPQVAANIKPYWERKQALPVEPSPTRLGPKVKTRPATGSSANGASHNMTTPILEQPLGEVLELPVFIVRKNVYETFELIFSGGEKGQLNFADFEYVCDGSMVSLQC